VTGLDRKPRILLFVKYPEPGRVKTRLARTLGPERAAEVHRLLVAEVLRRLPPGVELQVWFDPPDQEGDVRAWLDGAVPAGTRYHPQSAGDLGRRLTAAFRFAFEDGAAGPAAAIGGDCPDISAAVFAEAWDAIAAGADAAVGPSRDGGYYLIALARPCPELFGEIGWGGENVLEQTLARAGKAGRKVHVLPLLADVDTGEDWARVRARFESR
jgi:rSAM/selenodomain-associated transferase 1